MCEPSKLEAFAAANLVQDKLANISWVTSSFSNSCHEGSWELQQSLITCEALQLLWKGFRLKVNPPRNWCVGDMVVSPN